ncbi:double zinc ribbon domain-containing protein [Dankookia sp. P2]|uniref:double zinc ribbon domain-containing protein n=1 Tax=Dankookia sp. P2 TaxID=3423955 RepID=UPI003D67DEA6
MYPTCQHCDAPAASGRFCDHCGAPLEKPCPACQTPNRLVARFCTHCGAGFAAGAAAGGPAVAASREREAQYKHATILFADLCDSTGLIAAMDAEDARRLARPRARHDGRRRWRAAAAPSRCGWAMG